MSENRSQLKTMPFKVQNKYTTYLSELAYDALEHAFNVNMGGESNFDDPSDARVKECANAFYDKGYEGDMLETECEDNNTAERLPAFAKLCKAYVANTALTATYDRNCCRFVELGWVPPAHKAVRAAVEREAADMIRDMDGPFGSLPVRSDHFPAEWWEEAEEAGEDGQEGEEGEEGEEEASEEEEGEEEEASEEEEEVEADSADEDEEAEAQGSDESDPEEGEDEDEEEQDEENVHPNKKRKA